MKRAVTVITILAATTSRGFAAPQFLTETIRSNCRSEVTTVFEETETEAVNKVICQTEFRDECVKNIENVCRNVSSGVEECQKIDNFVCVDSMTNKCGIEKVLKNVSYTETVCDNKPQDICEYEFVDGESRPVTGSCVSKTVEDCQEVTRFQEEFVDEELCRDIPIKDCQNVQDEVCSEKQKEVCDTLETEKCDVVPHEECRQVVEKIPTKISKKVTKVVCAEDTEEENKTEAPESDNSNNIINDIFEIFGVSNSNVNEVSETTTKFMIDDGLLAETTSETTTKSATPSTTTKTTSTTLIDEFLDSSTEAIMDGSKIIFSDKELEERNKDLANRVYVGHGHLPSSTEKTETKRRNNPHSRIFFPE